MGRLFAALLPLADAQGLEVRIQVALFDTAGWVPSGFETPDLMVFQPQLRRDWGVDGPALLVVEVASPGDDTYARLPFYSRIGVRELVIVDQERKLARCWRDGPDGLVEMAPGPDRWLALDSLPLRLRTATGRLHLRGDMTEAVI
jgi:Uma2 family endonuclease